MSTESKVDMSIENCTEYWELIFSPENQEYERLLNFSRSLIKLTRLAIKDKIPTMIEKNQTNWEYENPFLSILKPDHPPKFKSNYFNYYIRTDTSYVQTLSIEEKYKIITERIINCIIQPIQQLTNRLDYYKIHSKLSSFMENGQSINAVVIYVDVNTKAGAGTAVPCNPATPPAGTVVWVKKE